MSGLVNTALNFASYVAAGINLASKNDRDVLGSLTLINSVRQIEAIDEVHQTMHEGFSDVNETLYDGFNELVYGLHNINENIADLRNTTEVGFNVLYKSSIDIRNTIEEWGNATVNAINQSRYEASIFYQDSLSNQKITHQKLDQINQLLELNLAEQIKQTIALENPDQAKSLEKLNTALKKIKLFERKLSKEKLNDAINSCDEAIALDPFNEAAYFYSAKWLTIRNTICLSDDSDWKERYIESKNRTIIELDNSIASQKKLAEENALRLSISASVDLINNLDFKLFRKEFYTFAKKYCPEDFLIYIEAFNFYALCFADASETTFKHLQRAVKKFGFDEFLQVVMENKIAISAIWMRNPSILTFCLNKLSDYEDNKLQDFMFSLSNEAGKFSRLHKASVRDDSDLEQNSHKAIKFKSLNSFKELGENPFNIYNWRIDNISFDENAIFTQKRDTSIPKMLSSIENAVSKYEKDFKLLKNKSDELDRANTNYKKELVASSNLIHEVISKKDKSPNKIKYIEEIERAIKRILRLLSRDRSDKRLKEHSILKLKKRIQDNFDDNIIRLIELCDLMHFEDIKLSKEYDEINDKIAMKKKLIEDKVIASKKFDAMAGTLSSSFIYWLFFGSVVWWWQDMTIWVIYLSVLLGFGYTFFKRGNRLKEIGKDLDEKKVQINNLKSKLDNLRSGIAQEVITRRKINLLKNLSEEDLLVYPKINNYLRMVFDISQEFDRYDHSMNQWKHNSKIFNEFIESFNFEDLLNDLKKVKKLL